MTVEKYDRGAERFTELEYADPARYLGRRAELVRSFGLPLEPGDTVLDLACADAGFAAPIEALGLRYRGVDGNEKMIAVGSRRAQVELADIRTYEPPAPVAATTIFRSLYYAPDLATFFRHVAGYTEKKLVFDFVPRRDDPETIRRRLLEAGFARVEVRPWLVPQHVALGVLTAAARVLEHSGPLARALLRFRFSYLCAASKR